MLLVAFFTLDFEEDLRLSVAVAVAVLLEAVVPVEAVILTVLLMRPSARMVVI